MFSGRTRRSQARCPGSQVRASRHSHYGCAETGAVLRYHARCSRALTATTSLPNHLGNGELRALFRSTAWRHDCIPKALYLNPDVIIAGNRHMLLNPTRLTLDRLYQRAKLIA